jgi:hypothetical protein
MPGGRHCNEPNWPTARPFSPKAPHHEIRYRMPIFVLAVLWPVIVGHGQRTGSAHLTHQAPGELPRNPDMSTLAVTGSAGHHRIGAGASDATMVMVIRPGQRRWAGRRRHGNADTHGSPASPAVRPGQYHPNAARGAARNPQRPRASRGSDPDQRPTLRDTVPASSHVVVAYRSPVALPTIMTRDAAMHRQGVGAAAGV